MTNIVARLRAVQGDNEDAREAAAAIERLRAEVEQWKQRYEAERRDHEITIAFCDKIISEGDWMPAQAMTPYQHDRDHLLRHASGRGATWQLNGKRKRHAITLPTIGGCMNSTNRAAIRDRSKPGWRKPGR